MRAIPILLAGLAGCMSVPDPDEGWVLLEEKGGIAISARGLEDADFPRLRGVAVLDADPLEVIAVFSDVNRSAEWVPNLVEARYLAPPSNEATWVYQRGRAPIPAHLIVWDRDVVMFTELIPIEEGRSWRAEFLAGEPDRVDVPTKVVRMPHMAGHAYIERSEDGRTRIEFEVELDAGGSIPEGVRMFVIRELPFKMIKALGRRVEETRGEYADLVAHWRANGVDLSEID